MELWPVTITYLQSSGSTGVFHFSVKPSDFAKTIPAVLSNINRSRGKVIRYVVGAPIQYMA